MGTQTTFSASSKSRVLAGCSVTIIMSRDSAPKWKAHKDMEIDVNGLGAKQLINA
jgi:hypothetical protein